MNPPLTTRNVSKSDRICSCGTPISQVGNEPWIYWPHLCHECEEEAEKRCRLQAIRDGHKERAACMRKDIEYLMPPLYRGAHLRNLSPKLRSKMLILPPNKGLLLYGPPGVGKTYSMCALMRYYRLKGFAVSRIVYEQLCLEIRETYIAGGSEMNLIKRYQEVDKLLIEDLGTTVGTGSQESDFSLRIFLLILDRRLEYYRPIFITTNKSVEELAKSFDERVASRLRQACEIIPVGGKDKRR